MFYKKCEICLCFIWNAWKMNRCIQITCSKLNDILRKWIKCSLKNKCGWDERFFGYWFYRPLIVDWTALQPQPKSSTYFWHRFSFYHKYLIYFHMRYSIYLTFGFSFYGQIIEIDLIDGKLKLHVVLRKAEKVRNLDLFMSLTELNWIICLVTSCFQWLYNNHRERTNES